MRCDLHGVSTADSHHQPQCRDRFRPSKLSPSGRRAPDRRRRLPWQLRVHVEQFNQGSEGSHRRAPRLLRVSEPSSRDGAPRSLLLTLQRQKMYLHCRGGRSVLECELYSFAKESEAVLR